MNDGDKPVDRTRRVLVGLCLLAAIALIIAFTIRPQPSASPGHKEQAIVLQQVRAEDHPIAVSENGYVGSDSCRECHEHNYDTWYDSYHRTMTQVASRQTSAASFDDVEIEFADPELEKVTLRQNGDELSFETEEKDAMDQPQIVRRPIVLLTGSHISQGYWYPSGQGRALKRFPFTYRIDLGRWIPDGANFLQPPGNHSHSDSTGTWTQLCARCHTTSLHPRIDDNGIFDTHVADFGISCEACHGPGEQHIENVGLESDDLAIVQPEKLSPARSSEVCGQCHAATRFKSKEDFLTWRREGLSYHPGDELAEYLHVKDSDIHTFWSDGMVRLSGREYNGLLSTPCFNHGDSARQMTCMSCHVIHPPEDDPRPVKEWANDLLKLNMDSNRPGLQNNEACTQCHEEYADEAFLTNHTHHEISSSGSICYNCHMPHTAWGLMRASRSHTISSPNVQESLDPVGRPNACNLCHLDKPLSWTAAALNRQYGHSETFPRMSDDQREIAAGMLWALKGDAAVRALVSWGMGWQPARETAGTYWTVPVLANLLLDPYDAVRLTAFNTLKTIEGYEDLDYDFVGSQEQREAAVEWVLQIWQHQRQAEKWGASDSLLLDEAGQLKEAEMQRLLRWRDDRDVIIAE